MFLLWFRTLLLTFSFSAGERSSSPLPDFVPNTHPDEPSHPPSTNFETGTGRKVLKRRATSAEPRLRSPSVEKAATEDETRPRKVCPVFFQSYLRDVETIR